MIPEFDKEALIASLDAATATFASAVSGGSATPCRHCRRLSVSAAAVVGQRRWCQTDIRGLVTARRWFGANGGCSLGTGVASEFSECCCCS